MSYLEEDLKAALRPVDAPAGFAGRVIARTIAPQSPVLGWWTQLGILLRPPRVQWVALSLLASMLIPIAGVQYRAQLRTRAEGEMAKERLVYAMRIAGVKLHRAQKKFLEMTQTDHTL
jgi:hypothetical protein